MVTKQRKKFPSEKAAESFAAKKRSVAAAASKLPSKITADVIAAICAEHGAGGDLHRVCHDHGISAVAWWHMLRKHRAAGTGREVLEAWEEARENYTGQMEVLAERLALSCDVRSPTMLIFMLKARKPEVYGERMRHDGRIDVGFPANFAMAMERALSGERLDAAPTAH